MSELLGVPLHPLVVHAVVVLIPLSALLLFLSLPFRRRRPALTAAAAALALLALLITPVAVWTGRRLLAQVDQTELVSAHVGAADRLLPWVLLLAVGTSLYAVACRYRVVSYLKEHSSVLQSASYVFVLFLALSGSIGATIMVGVIGHSGSKAVYEHVLEHDHGAHGAPHDSAPHSSHSPTEISDPAQPLPSVSSPATDVLGTQEVRGEHHDHAPDAPVHDH